MDRERVVLIVDGRRHQVALHGASALIIRHGCFWTDLALFNGNQRLASVDGLPNFEGKQLARALLALTVGENPNT